MAIGARPRTVILADPTGTSRSYIHCSASAVALLLLAKYVVHTMTSGKRRVNLLLTAQESVRSA
jgi:hypothetical protein